MSDKRVLSIQSHVVSGHVGNSSAVFPMQLLGLEVDALNTVQFSNHTGYPSWGGSRMDDAHILSLFEGLEKNSLCSYSHVLTGYVGNPAALSAISGIIDKLAELNPELVYVCDPVMGEVGRGLYVAPEVVPIYKALLPKATCATPNQFEAELLTGVTINSLETMAEALHKLYDLYSTPHILISSCELDGYKDKLVCGGYSHAIGHMFTIVFPKFAEPFTGCGDLFSALVTARIDPTLPLSVAAEWAVATLQAVLKRTREHAIKTAGGTDKAKLLLPPEDYASEEPEAKSRRCRLLSLRLIQSAAEIIQPRVDILANTLEVMNGHRA